VSKANGYKVAGVGSPYNHTQLTNGTTYYYVVTAVDGAGAESAESSQVSATPVAPAGLSDGTQVELVSSISSPYIYSPTTGEASVTLYWSDVYLASSYNLYWSTTPGVSKSNGNKIAGVGSPYNHTNLINGTTYYYVVTAVDGAGAESAESSQVSATPVTPAGGWSDGTQVGLTADFFSISPQSVQINNAGTAVAGWQETNFWGDSYVYANIYQGGTWHTATLLGSLGASSISVALTPSGDAIAVYCQSFFNALGPVRTLLNSRRYNHLTDTWSAAEQISVSTVDGSFASDPGIAVDSNGNAIAIWMEDSETWARRFDATLGAWETSATHLSTRYQYQSVEYPPKIVVDGSNIFTAVWVEADALGAKINATVFARRFNATPNTWDTSVRIGHDPAVLPGTYDGASFPWVDVNTAGNVFVVWQQRTTLPDNTTQYSIDSSRFDPVAKTWSTPVALTAIASLAPLPGVRESLAYSTRVAVDNAGNAMAAWLQTGTTGSSLQTARFAATGNTWSAPMLTDQTGTDTIASIVLGIDGNGNAEVIWSDTTGIVERRYNAATSAWSGFNAILGPKPNALIGAMSDTGNAALLGDTTGSTLRVAAWGWTLTP
jgi:hypothetical protein